MKRCMLAAVCLLFCLSLDGCGKTPKIEPTPTPKSTQSQFESYVSQTAFTFPKSWEYQEDEELNSGLTAVFAFDGGSAAVQFLWMDEEQSKSNVFLQQLDIDDVAEQACSAGPYEGTLVSGHDGETYTIAFEGSRSWYDTTPGLYMRLLLIADGSETYEKERANFMNLLQSVTIASDETPQASDQSSPYRYDFMEEFGLQLQAPDYWPLKPEYNAEKGYISLSYELATGDNIYRAELATVSQKEYDSLVQSLRDLNKGEDVFDYTFEQKDGVYAVTCLQEGKINRVRLQSQKVDGKIRYLWVSSALRPVLDAAYYQSVVAPVTDSIIWKK